MSSTELLIAPVINPVAGSVVARQAYSKGTKRPRTVRTRWPTASTSDAPAVATARRSRSTCPRGGGMHAMLPDADGAVPGSDGETPTTWDGLAVLLAGRVDGVHNRPSGGPSMSITPNSDQHEHTSDCYWDLADARWRCS